MSTTMLNIRDVMNVAPLKAHICKVAASQYGSHASSRTTLMQTGPNSIRVTVGSRPRAWLDSRGINLHVRDGRIFGDLILRGFSNTSQKRIRVDLELPEPVAPKVKPKRKPSWSLPLLAAMFVTLTAVTTLVGLAGGWL